MTALIVTPDLRQAHIEGTTTDISNGSSASPVLSVTTAQPWVDVVNGNYLKFTEAGIYHLWIEARVAGINADSQVRPGTGQLDFSGVGNLTHKPTFAILPTHQDFTMTAAWDVVVTDESSGSAINAASVGEELWFSVAWSEVVAPVVPGGDVTCEADIYVLRLA